MNTEAITRVVVLNANYTFLNIIDWKKCMCLLEKGKVQIVKYSDALINSIQGAVRIPAVIRLIKLVRTVYKARVPFSKKNVYIRDGFKCCYCGKTGIRLTIDHVVPKSKGGKSTFENCVAACFECNNQKGHKTCREAKMFPKSRMNQPTISEFMQMKIEVYGIGDFLKDLFTNDLTE
jgi:5-methylcytosine-specific restriction endonuclease McrA